MVPNFLCEAHSSYIRCNVVLVTLHMFPRIKHFILAQKEESPGRLWHNYGTTKHQVILAQP